MKAERFIPKGWIYPSPGYTDERIWLFMAEGLSPSSEYRRDDDEFIEVLRVPLSALPGMIANATIIDAKTICLVCRCFG